MRAVLCFAPLRSSTSNQVFVLLSSANTRCGVPRTLGRLDRDSFPLTLCSASDLVLRRFQPLSIMIMESDGHATCIRMPL